MNLLRKAAAIIRLLSMSGPISSMWFFTDNNGTNKRGANGFIFENAGLDRLFQSIKDEQKDKCFSIYGQCTIEYSAITRN